MLSLTAKVLTFFQISVIATPAVANDCLQNRGLSTLDKGVCLQNEEASLEAEMVAAYKLALGENAVADAPWSDRLNSALQKSQVDFEKLRQSQCDFEATQVQGGSATGLVFLACRNAMTTERVTYLLSYAGQN